MTCEIVCAIINKILQTPVGVIGVANIIWEYYCGMELPTTEEELEEVSEISWTYEHTGERRICHVSRKEMRILSCFNSCDRAKVALSFKGEVLHYCLEMRLYSHADGTIYIHGKVSQDYGPVTVHDIRFNGLPLHPPVHMIYDSNEGDSYIVPTIVYDRWLARAKADFLDRMLSRNGLPRILKRKDHEQQDE